MKILIVLFLVLYNFVSVYGLEHNLTVDQIKSQWENNYCKDEFSKIAITKTFLKCEVNGKHSEPFGAQMYFERYQNGPKVKIKSSSGLDAAITQIVWFPGDSSVIIDHSMSEEKTVLKRLSKFFSPDAGLSGLRECLGDFYVTRGSFLSSRLSYKGITLSPTVHMAMVGDINVPYCKLQSCIQDTNSPVPYYTTTEIWFAFENSMLPIKIEEKVVNDVNSFVYQELSLNAEKIIKIGTIWYPKEAIVYMRSNGGNFVSKCRYDIVELLVNTALDPNVFVPSFPKGTRVVDKIKGQIYIIGLDDIDQINQIQKIPKE